jgi:hypothetical protein
MQVIAQYIIRHLIRGVSKSNFLFVVTIILNNLSDTGVVYLVASMIVFLSRIEKIIQGYVLIYSNLN